MKPTTIQEHQEQFRTAPLGIWSTFDFLPYGAVVEFYENHVGLVYFFMGFGGEELAFEWRECSDWVIEIRPFWQTGAAAAESPTEDNPEDEEDVGSEWDLVRYDFKIVPCWGEDDQVTLFQTNSVYSFEGDWFWHILGPISYIGPTSTPTPVSPWPAPPPPAPVPETPEPCATYHRFRFAVLMGLAGGVFGFLVYLPYGLEPSCWLSLIVAVVLAVWIWFAP